MADIHINDVFDYLNGLKEANTIPMFAAVDELVEQFKIDKGAARFVLAKWMHKNGYIEK